MDPIGAKNVVVGKYAHKMCVFYIYVLFLNSQLPQGLFVSRKYVFVFNISPVSKLAAPAGAFFFRKMRSPNLGRVKTFTRNTKLCDVGPISRFLNYLDRV